jgi:hypothetical protein
MARLFYVFLAIMLVVSAVAYAGNGVKTARPQVMVETYDPSHVVPIEKAVHPGPVPMSLVGTYTGISGFYDYQNNGGAAQYIRVNPATGNIHTIMMIATDSLSANATRSTAYAYSTNGGVNWNTFSNVIVPGRRSGFPAMDLVNIGGDDGVVIVNHNVAGGLLRSMAYIDIPEGTGAFTESGLADTLGGADEAIWPYVAGANNGNIVRNGSRSGNGTNHITYTSDFTTWAPWVPYPGANSAGGRYPLAKNGTGRVAWMLCAVDDGPTTMVESTDDGVTWGSVTTIYPLPRISGSDTTAAWVAGDLVYNGDNVYAAVNTAPYDQLSGGYFYEGSGIHFWSAATGLVHAVVWDSTKFLATAGRGQVNHLSVGYPAIGMSGSTIVIVFAAMQADTAATGFNFFDLWMTTSGNAGVSWSEPVNITNTANLDERYPSVSKYNAPGEVNIVYQEDYQPGSSAFNDGAPLSRSRQVFLKMPITSVREIGSVASEYKLSQNYPNPFNPATKIQFSVPKDELVTLKVYNALGQEVRTLVNDVRRAGAYEVVFEAGNLPSGVYFYALTAGEFTSRNKMVLLK